VLITQLIALLEDIKKTDGDLPVHIQFDELLTDEAMDVQVRADHFVIDNGTRSVVVIKS